MFENRANWGLPLDYREDGKAKLHWLPKGIVIPTFEQKGVIKLKVRRTDWHFADKLPKYVEISGGLQCPSIYGDITKPIVIVEAEIDAILIQQFASDICCSLALGGVGKRPDKHTHEILKRAPLILLSLDYDEAGKKEYSFWMLTYANLRPWPASKGKALVIHLDIIK